MHIPVLLKETIEILNPKPNENFIDATFGEGGISLEIAKYTELGGKILAFEWDPELYKLGVEKLKNLKMEKRIKLVNQNFREIKKIVKKEKFTKIMGVVFDLGISSWHYEKSKRGFSFKYDEPLDMRINPNETKITAFEIVNYYSYKDLTYILQNYGEERSAKKIAQAILERRKIKKIESTKELAEIVSKVKKTKKDIHPATQTFMALRIFINQELENLKDGILNAYDVLDKGGKIIVISFQGLEDIVIKKVFRYLKREKFAEIITKNVIKPKKEEILKNPKARSAKLRAIKKQ